jgi:hypothetical protein
MGRQQHVSFSGQESAKERGMTSGSKVVHFYTDSIIPQMRQSGA